MASSLSSIRFICRCSLFSLLICTAKIGRSVSVLFSPPRCIMAASYNVKQPTSAVRRTMGGVRPASMSARAAGSEFPIIGRIVDQANSWAFVNRSYNCLISVVSSCKASKISSSCLPCIWFAMRFTQVIYTRGTGRGWTSVGPFCSSIDTSEIWAVIPSPSKCQSWGIPPGTDVTTSPSMRFG